MNRFGVEKLYGSIQTDKFISEVFGGAASFGKMQFFIKAPIGSVGSVYLQVCPKRALEDYDWFSPDDLKITLLGTELDSKVMLYAQSSFPNIRVVSDLKIDSVLIEPEIYVSYNENN